MSKKTPTIEIQDELTSLFHILMNIESYTGSFYNPNVALNFYETDGSFIETVLFSRTLCMKSDWYDRFAAVAKVSQEALNIYFIS